MPEVGEITYAYLGGRINVEIVNHAAWKRRTGPMLCSSVTVEAAQGEAGAPPSPRA